MNRTAFIALGSNEGDRTALILRAVEALDTEPGISVFRVSTLLETAPVGRTDQTDFVNGVAEVRTSLSPVALLEAMLRIERSMGRRRSEGTAGGPRPIDLDLLLVEDLIERTPTLRLPHPRLHERAFVLVPMVELDPDRIHPVQGRTMRELLAAEIAQFGRLEDRCRPVGPGPLLSGEDSGESTFT